MIALLDYGAGNVRSVEKALRYLGAEVNLTADSSLLEMAAGAVLPGVGAFADCVRGLERHELFQAINKFIGTGRPFLGICVGYQVLFEGSDEFDSDAGGLGYFRGRVRRFSEQPGLKVPQIGWNQLDEVKTECPFLKGVSEGTYVYFVHSYFPDPEDKTIVASQTTYGRPFASSVWRENVFATQFHPEKSQEAGLQILSNFLALSGK